MTPGCVDELLYDRFFADIFSQLNERELNWLFGDDQLHSIRVYNHEQRASRFIDWNDAPWPVVFFLGFLHKKHRFVSTKLPSPKYVVKYVSDAINRFRWHVHFANSESVKQHKSLRYRRRTQVFNRTSPPEVDGLCFQLRSFIHSGILEGIRKSRLRSHRSWANVRPIELAARDWLASSKWAALPSDKCGGFVLVELDTLHQVQMSLLCGPWYSEFGPDCAEQTWRSLVPQYRRICKKVLELDDRVTYAVLFSSLDTGSKGLASTLIHTVKTHKPPGSVAFRPVHASGNHCFTGLMAWISLVLDCALQKYRHLLQSSDDFLDRIRSSSHDSLEYDDVWLHMDLKDFFMTGSVAFLYIMLHLLFPCASGIFFGRRCVSSCRISTSRPSTCAGCGGR